jgi:hypothetical protein
MFSGWGSCVNSTGPQKAPVGIVPVEILNRLNCQRVDER